MTGLSRLFAPRDVAVIGGGAWCAAVAEQLVRMGFKGTIARVHPTRGDFTKLSDLPRPPDAAFVGVNRHATIDVVAELSTLGAGGAVCFASGFREAEQEDAGGASLQDALIEAAGAMPVLGPNCYGFVNALDRACLWPDQHGLVPVDRGVAILTQSSNIGINLTMSARALPIAAMICVGNQAQTGMAQIARHLAGDPRITAIGLHVEGFSDIRAWEAFASEASALGKPVVALKVGRSEQARAATVSHTASLAGADTAADALLRRLGIARVESLPVLLEALKLLHMGGTLGSGRLASISCSGGEASLAADAAQGRRITFPPLDDRQRTGLRDALGPLVALANPLDYHTYIWRDTAAMTRAWAAVMTPDIALTLVIVDFPRADRCDPADWDCAIEAAVAARQQTGQRVAMVATLPEAMPEPVAERLAAAGVVPLLGLNDAIAAAEAALPRGPLAAPLLLPPVSGACTTVLQEADAKQALAASGVPVPRGGRARTPAEAAAVAETLGATVALKGEGAAHKTEIGAVRLNLTPGAPVAKAARTMPATAFLVEEMINGGVAELLVGVTKDPAHGFLLTLAAGGTLTELLADSASLLVPASRDAVSGALAGLRIAPMLSGYRGSPPTDMQRVLDAIMAVQDYVQNHADRIEELEINPLICTPDRAIAADALVRLRTPPTDQQGDPTDD